MGYNDMKMKAAVYHGPRDLRVEEVDVRELKDNEVLIRVKYCGICGTDVHIFHGDGGAFEVTPPLVPGHEFSGVVEKVGSKVTQVKVGDRVKKGDTVGIIEAMKLMNEVIADTDGVVEEICIENAQTVDFGCVLMRIRP